MAAAPTRALLERDGAVILTGLPPKPDSLTLAAAEVLGTRLSRLYPVHERASDRDDRIHLHCDNHNVVVDIHGRLTRLRDPDEDYVLIQCVRQATRGGSSLVADGYRRRPAAGHPPGPVGVPHRGNYRCWHGRDPHDMPRHVRIMTVRTTDAL